MPRIEVVFRDVSIRMFELFLQSETPEGDKMRDISTYEYSGSSEGDLTIHVYSVDQLRMVTDVLKNAELIYITEREARRAKTEALYQECKKSGRYVWNEAEGAK